MGANPRPSWDTKFICAAALLRTSELINSIVKYVLPLCAYFAHNYVTQVCWVTQQRPRLLISGPAVTGWGLTANKICHVLLQQCSLAKTQHYVPKTACAKAEIWCNRPCPSLLQKIGRMKRKHYCFLQNSFLMTAWVPGLEQHTVLLAVSINT